VAVTVATTHCDDGMARLSWRGWPVTLRDGIPALSPAPLYQPGSASRGIVDRRPSVNTMPEPDHHPNELKARDEPSAGADASDVV